MTKFNKKSKLKDKIKKKNNKKNQMMNKKKPCSLKLPRCMGPRKPTYLCYFFIVFYKGQIIYCYFFY